MIDAERDVLALQDPPNDGVLATVGALGVNFGPLGGFDILTDTDGRDRAWAASGSVLYAVDLATGGARVLGEIAGVAPAGIVGLAALAGAPDAPPAAALSGRASFGRPGA